MTFIKNRKIILLLIFSIISSISLVPAGETVHVGLYSNPPYIFPEGSSHPGITVEIINHIANQKNFNVIYHYSTYEVNLDLLSIGMIDVLPALHNKSINNSLYPYQIHLKSENANQFSFYNGEDTFIPCILVKKTKTASLFKDSGLYSKMVPLTRSFKTESGFYKTILDKYRSYMFPSFFKNRVFFFVIIFIISGLLILLFFIHLPVLKSINSIGREIISEFESPDFFGYINKKVSSLINYDYLCIGDFEQDSINLSIFAGNRSKIEKFHKEEIGQNDSCFIYAVKNKKTVYIRNSNKDYLKYVRNNLSLKNIDSKVNSAFIIPLIFNSELQGAAAVMDKRKNAFSFIKRYLFISVSKYITISLKNRKLINKNKELLSCIENDKNQILKAKQEVEYLAQHDPLTNLPNRLYLNEFLNQSIKKSNRTGKKLAVIFIDMDNFKEANDTYGHQTGDKVLIAAAKRFKNLLRESDIVIRFGGDEFIIILEDINSADDVKQVANKIINTCTAPVLTESADLSLSFSIGISMYPDNGSSADELIRKADIALYSVKNNVKGKWKFYSESKGQN